MASSSSSKSSQRINSYLDSLRDEFKLLFDPSTISAIRCNVYIGNLRSEFELMSVEIETLRKGMDEYKTKVENIDDTSICERCSKETASAPRIVVSSQARRTKTTSSLFSSRFFKFKSRDQPRTSSDASSREVASTQTRRSTQHMTVIQRLHSAMIPIRPSQSVSRSLDTTIAHTIARPPSPEPSDLIVDVGSRPVDRNWSITFNPNAEKELDVELTHALFPRYPIHCVKFSSDGKNLAVGCENAYIYDVEAGILSCVLRNLLAEHEDITSVCFSRDGKYLATGTWEGCIYLWKIKEKYVRNAFRGHTDRIWSLGFSPNDRLLVSASRDNTVRLWNMRDGSARALIEDIPTFLDRPQYYSAVFSPDGRYVAAVHRDGIVRMWNVRTGRLMRRLDMQDCLEYWRTLDVKFMPDGKRLVVSGSRTFQCWDISTLGATRTADDCDGHVPGVEEQTEPERELSGHKDLIYSLAISPDGRWAASGSEDDSVRIWDTRNAVIQCILDNVHEAVDSVDISPSGPYLASGGFDGTVRIWRCSYMAPSGS